MASTRTFRWTDGAQIWFVAARFLAESGYDNVSTFAEAIRAANPQIVDWASVPVGTLITVPYMTS